MKKLIIILLIPFLFLSCTKSEAPKGADPLPLTFPMKAEAHLSCEAGNARVILEYESADRYTVRYTEPKIMTGITYGIDGEGAYMAFGESRIPVTRGDACFASLAIGRLLCPKSEDEVKIEYEDGLPVRTEGTVDGFTGTLTEIMIQGR